jgi:hypothetical protein
VANRFERAVVALTAAALVPVWLFRYFPTQDGPSHLYNALVLGQLGDATSRVLREFFVLNARVFPNWTMYALMAPLTKAFPPLAVQQIMLSICIVAIPASVLYLQRSVKGEADASALFGVAFAYNALFFLGFFNFVMGAALFVVIIGTWVRQCDGDRKNALLTLYALLAITYFTHLLPFAAAVMSVALLETLRRRLRVLLELAPAFAVVAWDALPRIGAAREYRSVMWHLQGLLDLQPFVYFGDAHVWIARASCVLLVIAIWMTKRRAAMAAVTAVLFVLYWILPWGYGAGGWTLGGWVNDRVLFLALLTLPAWIEVPRRLSLLVAAVVVLHLAVTAVDASRFHSRMLWLDDARPLVRESATVARIGGAGETLHAGAYLALRHDVAYLDNYEAALPDFPIVFRSSAPKRPPDYLLVWNDAHVRNVAGYRILYTGEEIRLFQRAGL